MMMKTTLYGLVLAAALCPNARANVALGELAGMGFDVPSVPDAVTLPVSWGTSPRDYSDIDGHHFLDADGREYLRIVKDYQRVHYLDGDGRALFHFEGGFDKRYSDGDGRELMRITGISTDRHYADADGREILSIVSDWNGVHYADGDGRDVWHEWRDWDGRHAEGDSQKLSELLARVSPQGIVALVPSLEPHIARLIAADLANR